MTRYNPDNERLKRRYFEYLREARRRNEASVDQAAAALARFEAFTGYKPFKAFHIEQAVAFKRHLAAQRSQRSRGTLSKATLHATLAALRAFFVWLAGQPGFRRRICYSDADYFQLSERETRIARTRRERPAPSLEQVLHVLNTLPAGTEIERRDRAVIAFALLTGARDGALASLRLKHVDLAEGKVVQDGREVNTKFGKTIVTWFFPVGDPVRRIVEDWVTFLRDDRLSGPDDPLFPATKVVVGADGHFAAAGLDRRVWSTAAPIRRIFKQAFEQAGLPGFHPHSIRTTLTRLGEQRCRTPEQFKAWSQNLGHEKVMTTFTSYGSVPSHRQAAILHDLGQPTDQDEETARRVLAALRSAN
ncbi:MAG: tyrosine-type recombinase/integrase [Azospirillaceae bacterium]